MTKKQNIPLAFRILNLDLILVVLNCECLLEEKLLKTFVGASTDQLNQNLWEKAQTLAKF